MKRISGIGCLAALACVMIPGWALCAEAAAAQGKDPLMQAGYRRFAAETVFRENAASLEEQLPEDFIAVYLGVEGYGMESVNKDTIETFRYRFWRDDEELLLPVYPGIPGEDGRYPYEIQNHLEEGGVYHLTVYLGRVVSAEPVSAEPEIWAEGLPEDLREDSFFLAEGEEADENGIRIRILPETKIRRITAAAGGASVTEDVLSEDVYVQAVLNPGGMPEASDEAEGAERTARTVFLTDPVREYDPPLSGVPGFRTLKNFLSTAFTPVGTTLYVYGGDWDWQDEGSSVQSTTIGLPREWLAFFQSQTENYTYKDPDDDETRSDPAHSYYPYGRYNEYYYLGADCSGYVSWVVYNTLNTESGCAGYVSKSTGYAKKMALLGLGDWTQAGITVPGNPQDPGQPQDTGFRTLPGDIVSMVNHVWISLGTCADGSVLLLHSNPCLSRTGQPGGGVQLGAIGWTEDCQAYRLAESYVSVWYPEWYSRYRVSLKNPVSYFAFTGEDTGLFRWNLSGENGCLSDPEGIRAMPPEEILAELFDRR